MSDDQNVRLIVVGSCAGAKTHASALGMAYQTEPAILRGVFRGGVQVAPERCIGCLRDELVCVYNPVDGLRMKCPDGERPPPASCPLVPALVVTEADLPAGTEPGEGLPGPTPRCRPGPPLRLETHRERNERWRREAR